MNKTEYIEMLLQDNETEANATNKALYADVIDCAEIALSQTPDTFQVDASIGLPELWKVIKDKATETKAQSIGPFQSAELLAEKLGTKYTRASRRKSPAKVDISSFI